MSKLTLLINKFIPQSLERKIRTFRDKNLRKYNIEKLPAEIYNQEKFYAISLCITCMNRLFHLKETIEQNIKDNAAYPHIEFVLIDYNSQDGLEDYVKENLQSYIDKGILNYYKTTEPKNFHASYAKNLSHALAQGEIVCNLDGDNFTGKDFAFYLNYLFNKKGENSIYQFFKRPLWGTVGRLSFYKEVFNKLGGYDEALLPIGHEDLDLVNRAREMGINLDITPIENFLKYLSNTTKEKAENCTDTNEDYYSLMHANIEISNENIRNGRLKANSDGMKNFVVYRNFEKQPLNSKDLIEQYNNKVFVK